VTVKIIKAPVSSRNQVRRSVTRNWNGHQSCSLVEYDILRQMKGADGLTQILWRNRPDESKTPVPSVSQFNCCLGPTIKSLARVFVLLIRDLMFELRETKL
jgi:hypothetical protein